MAGDGAGGPAVARSVTLTEVSGGMASVEAMPSVNGHWAIAAATPDIPTPQPTSRTRLPAKRCACSKMNFDNPMALGQSIQP